VLGMVRSTDDHGIVVEEERGSSPVIWRWRDSSGRWRGDSQGCAATPKMRRESLGARGHQRGRLGGDATLVRQCSGERGAAPATL
jgi:hypothetical protein